MKRTLIALAALALLASASPSAARSVAASGGGPRMPSQAELDRAAAQRLSERRAVLAEVDRLIDARGFALPIEVALRPVGAPSQFFCQLSPGTPVEVRGRSEHHVLLAWSVAADLPRCSEGEAVVPAPHPRLDRIDWVLRGSTMVPADNDWKQEMLARVALETLRRREEQDEIENQLRRAEGNAAASIAAERALADSLRGRFSEAAPGMRPVVAAPSPTDPVRGPN